jgi:hypothetical protein
MLKVVLLCRSTALVYAVNRDCLPIATALIDANADLNAKTLEGFAYFHARKRRFASPREAREDQRLRACLCRDFSLIIALEYGHLEMAKLLLLRGADVKLQRSTGYNTVVGVAPQPACLVADAPISTSCAAEKLLCTGLRMRASTIWSGCFWRMTPPQKA